VTKQTHATENKSFTIFTIEIAYFLPIAHFIPYGMRTNDSFQLR